MPKKLKYKYMEYAPKATQQQNTPVISLYNIRRNVAHHIVEETVLALYLPSAFGRVGQRGNPSKGDKIYEDFVSVCQDNKPYPEDNLKTVRFTDRLIERKETNKNQEKLRTEGRAHHAREEGGHRTQ